MKHSLKQKRSFGRFPLNASGLTLKSQHHVDALHDRVLGSIVRKILRRNLQNCWNNLVVVADQRPNQVGSLQEFRKTTQGQQVDLSTSTDSNMTYELVDKKDADVRAVGDLAEEFFNHRNLRLYCKSSAESDVNQLH
jgi:hypothetical protein